MKKLNRQIYIILASEIKWCLCGFCRYSKFGGGSTCDDEGTCECENPLEAIVDKVNDMEWGVDCWGFSPYVSVRDIADIVGCVLANGWDPQKTQFWKTKEGGISVAGLPRTAPDRERVW